MNQLLNRKNNELAVKKKKGFTLIELIIVIAIIAILAAVAIPKFGAVRADANLAADRANAKIIATAVTTAVANGDVADADNAFSTDAEKAKFIKYIDGGTMPKAKIGTFTVTYDVAANGAGKGVVVTTSEGQMYPIS
jgi:type IV pilus assembly protein PilA